MAIQKEVLHKRIEAGNCTLCNQPNDRGKGWLCSSCLEKSNLESRMNYKFYQSIGICPICRKNELFGNEKRCVECLAKASQNSSKYRANNKDKIKENMKAFSKRVYQERSEKGICTKCGKRKAISGIKLCSLCREKVAESKRKKVNYGERRSS